MFTAIEYLGKHKNIDTAWIQTLEEAEGYIAAWKWTVEALRLSLSQEDAAIVRSYNVAYRQAMSRKGRSPVARGVMEGRAELLARRRLELEDEALAVYFQALDVRAVEFKNKFWDFMRRPDEKRSSIGELST